MIYKHTNVGFHAENMNPFVEAFVFRRQLSHANSSEHESFDKWIHVLSVKTNVGVFIYHMATSQGSVEC